MNLQCNKSRQVVTVATIRWLTRLQDQILSRRMKSSTMTCQGFRCRRSRLRGCRVWWWTKQRRWLMGCLPQWRCQMIWRLSSRTWSGRLTWYEKALSNATTCTHSFKTYSSKTIDWSFRSSKRKHSTRFWKRKKQTTNWGWNGTSRTCYYKSRARWLCSSLLEPGTNHNTIIIISDYH